MRLSPLKNCIKECVHNTHTQNLPSQMEVALYATLYAAYTVDTVDTVYIIGTVETVYTVDTVDTVYTIQTTLHFLNSNMYA